MELFEKIRKLVEAGEYHISDHGYDELVNDDILQEEVLNGLAKSEVIEDYPDYFKGPSILLLQHDDTGTPLHVLWGIAKNSDRPAVLVTAYRPAPERWSSDFRKRKP